MRRMRRTVLPDCPSAVPGPVRERVELLFWLRCTLNQIAEFPSGNLRNQLQSDLDCMLDMTPTVEETVDSLSAQSQDLKMKLSESSSKNSKLSDEVCTLEVENDQLRRGIDPRKRGIPLGIRLTFYAYVLILHVILLHLIKVIPN